MLSVVGRRIQCVVLAIPKLFYLQSMSILPSVVPVELNVTTRYDYWRFYLTGEFGTIDASVYTMVLLC